MVCSDYPEQATDARRVARAGGDAAPVSGTKLSAPQTHLLTPRAVWLTCVTSQEMMLFRFFLFLKGNFE